MYLFNIYCIIYHFQLDWFNNLILGLKDGFVVGGDVFYTFLSFMLAVDPLYHLSISKWITRHLYDRRVQKEGSFFVVRGQHCISKNTRVLFFVIVDYIDQPFAWPPIEILSLAFYINLFAAFSYYSWEFFLHNGFVWNIKIKRACSCDEREVWHFIPIFTFLIAFYFHHIGVFFFFGAQQMCQWLVLEEGASVAVAVSKSSDNFFRSMWKELYCR